MFIVFSCKKVKDRRFCCHYLAIFSSVSKAFRRQAVLARVMRGGLVTEGRVARV